MIKEWSLFIIVFFVTLMLGYYLGLTIATVVDYRIKDAVINMPKPKNNIKKIIKKKPKKVNIESNKNEIENFLNYNKTPMKKCRKYKQLRYKSEPLDKSTKKYSKLYKNFEKDKNKNLNPIIPYNDEFSRSNFLEIKNGLNSQNTKNLKKKKNKWKSLPKRENRKQNFKCQRKYMTCTSDHCC